MRKTDRLEQMMESMGYSRNEIEEKRKLSRLFDRRMVVVLLVLLFASFSSPSNAIIFLIVLFFIVGQAIMRYRKLFRKNQDGDSRFEVSPELPAERGGISENPNRVKSKSFAEYSGNIVDPWDIKDEKPPWEL